MPRLDKLIRYSTVPWILILFCWLNSHAGVDHGQYLKWAEASVTGSVAALANEKEIVSTTGIPFSPWSAGPGLLIAPFYLLLMPLGLQDGSGLITGCLCVAVFWISFYHALRLLTNDRIAAFSCLISAIGTPLGYYCCSISSETLSLAPAGYLMWQAVRGLRGKSVQWFGLIAATAMLLMIRPFLGVFAWPALLCGLFRASSRLRFAGVTGLAVLFSAIQIAMVNHWMTGSWFQTPYSFGDDFFKSFDWTAPYLWHVLFDPFHGLLPTHPLVFAGLVCLPLSALLAASRKQWFACAVWTLYFLAIALNVYFQSCWFYWWMAKTSFGMRGLVLCSLPAILCLIDLKENWLESNYSKTSGRGSRAIAGKYFEGGLLALTFWGWLNLGAGPLNKSSFLELAPVLQEQFESWLSYSALIALIGSACLLSSTRFLNKDRKPIGFESPFGAIWFLTCAIFIRKILESNWNLTFAVVMVGLWVCLAAGLWSRRQMAYVLLGRTMVVGVLLMTAFFTWLSVDAHQTIQDVAIKKEESEDAKLMHVFNWPDTRRAYLTLLEIPRLEHQRNAIRGFFERNFDKQFVRENLPRTLNEDNGLLLQPVIHEQEFTKNDH